MREIFFSRADQGKFFYATLGTTTCDALTWMREIKVFRKSCQMEIPTSRGLMVGNVNGAFYVLIRETEFG